MNIFKHLLLQIFVIAMLCSCGKEGYDFGNEDNGQKPSADLGAVEFSVSTDYTIRTKAPGADLNLNPDNFSFAIFNEGGVMVNNWQSFSQIKGQSVKLNQGAYTAQAWYGDSTAIGFDAVYFVGRTRFQVEKLKTTQGVTVTCRQGNAKVAVVWGDTIRSEYPDYSAVVKRVGTEQTMSFAKDETRAGYVQAGNINLEVSMTDASGNTRTYVHETPIPVAAQDSLTLRVDCRKQGSTDGYVVISYNLDTTTTDKPQQITIPAFLVSKPAPELMNQGFDENNTIEFWEGDVSNPVMVMIKAQAFIDSCRVSLASPFVEVAFPDSIDIVHDSENAVRLQNVCGIKWDDQLQNKRYAAIDLTEFARNLRVVGSGVASESTTFTVSVVDKRGKKSGKTTYTLVAKRPVLSLNNVPEYDMWATKAYIELVTDVENLSLFKFEYLVNNIPNEANAALVAENGNVKRYEITGLAPGTSYIFRANYCNGLYYTNTVSVVTEAAQQLANGNMDTWSNTEWTTYGLQKIYHYYPGVSASDKSWSTRNSLTMEGVNGGTSSGTTNQVVAYRWNSCTIPTADAVSGSAAEIRTMALSTKSVAGTSVGTGALWSQKNIEAFMESNGKVYAGYLYTGTADVTSGSPVPAAAGISHPSRPLSVSFSYKYMPFNGDKFKVYAKVYDSNGSVIASTQEFVSGDAKGTYTEYTMDFTYSDSSKKASSIMVFFQSGTNETSDYVQFVDGSYDANPWSLDTFVGSILRVDNIVLNY